MRGPPADPEAAATTHTRYEGGRIVSRIQINWKAVRTRVMLASTLAHELAHVRFYHVWGITPIAVRILFTADEFCAMTWLEESRARLFEAKVMQEIGRAVPVLQPCILELDIDLQAAAMALNATPGGEAALASAIRELYPESDLRARHAGWHRSQTRETLAAAEPERRMALVLLPKLRQAIKPWMVFAPR